MKSWKLALLNSLSFCFALSSIAGVQGQADVELNRGQATLSTMPHYWKQSLASKVARGYLVKYEDSLAYRFINADVAAVNGIHNGNIAELNHLEASKAHVSFELSMDPDRLQTVINPMVTVTVTRRLDDGQPLIISQSVPIETLNGQKEAMDLQLDLMGMPDSKALTSVDITLSGFAGVAHMDNLVVTALDDDLYPIDQFTETFEVRRGLESQVENRRKQIYTLDLAVEDVVASESVLIDLDGLNALMADLPKSARLALRVKGQHEDRETVIAELERALAASSYSSRIATTEMSITEAVTTAKAGNGDLSVGFPFGNYSFHTGESFSIGVKISNTSPFEYSNQTSITWYKNGVAFPGGTIDSLPPNGETYAYATYRYTSAGTYEAKACIAGDSNPYNNCGTVDLSISDPPKPDVIITDISWSPATPIPGQAVTLQATIKNRGSADTPSGVAVGTGIRVNGSHVGSFFVRNSSGQTRSLNAGESYTGTADGTWSAAGSSFSIQAIADDINRFSESNESNNSRTETGFVNNAKPDVIITQITLSPANPSPGQTVTVRAKIKNQGSVSTPSGVPVGVGFQVNGSTLGAFFVRNYNGTIRSLGAGQTYEGTCDTTWTATSGTFSILAWADDIDRFDEENENNNTLTKTVNN